MASNKYGVREGSRVKGDPQKIGEELERIRLRYGELTAELVLKEAKRKTSPLHNEFTWEDSKAAHRFRLVESRTLLRSVTLIRPKHTPQTFFAHVPSPGKKKAGHYVPLEIVAQDEDNYAQALAELRTKLAGALRAVVEVEELAGKAKIKGKLAVIRIVAEALQTARDALKKLAE